MTRDENLFTKTFSKLNALLNPLVSQKIYPKTTGANWDAKTHIDCVFLKPTITFGYKNCQELTIVKDGEFTSIVKM